MAGERYEEARQFALERWGMKVEDFNNDISFFALLIKIITERISYFESLSESAQREIESADPGKIQSYKNIIKEIDPIVSTFLNHHSTLISLNEKLSEIDLSTSILQAMAQNRTN